jgi:hypothetical protein
VSKSIHLNVAALVGGLGFALIVEHFTNFFADNSNNEKIWGKRPFGELYFSELKYFQEQAPSFKQSLRVQSQKSQIEYAIVALKNLPKNMSLETSAAKIVKDWQIGSAYNGRGILLLYSEAEHAFKIEVTYALEGNYTDAQMGRLQDMSASFFRSGHSIDSFSELLGAFSEIAQLSGDDRSTAAANAATHLSGGAGAATYNFEKIMNDRMLNINGISAEELNKYAPAQSAEETAARYIRSLENGVGDPRLPLLTEGAQLMSLEYPRSSSYQISLAEKMKRVSPYKVIIKGDLAALRFREDAGIFPVYLRKTDKGLWLVDVPKSFAYTQLFENSDKIYHKNNTHPFIFAFPETLTNPNFILGAGRTNIPELLKYPFNLKSIIKEAELDIAKNPDDAAKYFRLSELLYFECYWMQSAVDLLEKGLKLNPNAKHYHWLATEIYANIPNINPIKEHWEAILRLDPKDSKARLLYKHYLKSYFPGDKRISEL